MKLSRRQLLGLGGAAMVCARAAVSRLRAASASPEIVDRAAEADRLITERVANGDVAAAALLVRRGAFEFARGYGKAGAETPFLLASPTKPMTASAVLWLRDHGELAVSDPVRRFLPRFTGGDRDRVTIRHLLTHTSGLPDMLPENVALRQRHAPLTEFVALTCTTPLRFRPGEKVSYQSMGILLAAAVAEKITGRPLPQLLEEEIFRPLGMTRTALGLGRLQLSETAKCQVPEPSDWDWNSTYWRNLGAPWGGAHSTVRDVAAFVGAFASDTPAPWPLATRREMREIQTGTLRPSYGFGWLREPGAFGGTCSPATFGHFGSTGTVAWHDPASGTTCVILTSKPAEESRRTVLLPVSEIVGRQ